MGFKKAGKGNFGSRGPARSFSRDSDRPPRSGGGTSFGARPGGRPTGRSNFELFDLKCDKCGKDCQVPFRPTSGKPVYCRDCFQGRSDDRPRRSGPAVQESGDELAQINEKLDRIMRALKID